MFSRSSLFITGLIAFLLASASPGAIAANAASTTTGGQTVLQVWTIGASTAWAWTTGENTGSAQGVARTSDGGRRWREVTPPGLGIQTGDRYITGLFALDASHAWVTYGSIFSGTPQTIVSTSDGGRHWAIAGQAPLTTISFSGSTYNCGLDFVSPSVGWCETTPPFFGSEAVYIYRTTDGGRNWKLVSDTPGPPPNPAGTLPWTGDKDTQFVTPRKGWTVFAEAGAVTAPLYESLDGGKTWVQRTVANAPVTFDGGSGFTGQPVVAGKAGAVGYTISGAPEPPHEESVVYVTNDGGLRWHAVVPPGQREDWLVDTITPKIWRLVSGNRILATDNAGRTWHTIHSDVSFSLFYAYDDPTAPVVNFTTPRTGWIVSTTSTGTSLWRTTDGGGVWRQITVPGT